MASNLVFTWQALVGVNTWALTVTIIVENFTGAIGTVIFVAYLSALCQQPAAHGDAICAAHRACRRRAHLSVGGRRLRRGADGLADRSS